MIKSNVLPRKLSKGWGWQTYKALAVKPISKEYFNTAHSGNKWNMNFEHDQWVDGIRAYANERAEQLGLAILKIEAQLVEEPNESKDLDVLYWKQNNCIFVWVAWITLAGPVPEQMIKAHDLPIFNFWPEDKQFYKDTCEFFDAEKLSAKEQAAR